MVNSWWLNGQSIPKLSFLDRLKRCSSKKLARSSTKIIIKAKRIRLIKIKLSPPRIFTQSVQSFLKHSPLCLKITRNASCMMNRIVAAPSTLATSWRYITPYINRFTTHTLGKIKKDITQEPWRDLWLKWAKNSLLRNKTSKHF